MEYFKTERGRNQWKYWHDIPEPVYNWRACIKEAVQGYAAILSVLIGIIAVIIGSWLALAYIAT